MKRPSTLIILFTILFSCQKNNKPKVDKLLLVEIANNLTYDSLDNPQMSIRTYIEFNNSNTLKYAIGAYHDEFDKNVPPYCLEKYYLCETSDTIKQLIERIVVNRSFDSSYVGKGEGFFYALIYSVSDTIRHIVYQPDHLPKDLYILDSLLRSQIGTSKLVKTNPFMVDYSLTEFEKYIFRINPPPRPVKETLEFKHPKDTDATLINN